MTNYSLCRNPNSHSNKPVPIQSVLRILAGQEGRDGKPWDQMAQAADYIDILERERDEARALCRWAFPRLRAMCHDFDATGIGWRCAEEMESRPEIFSSENDKDLARRALDSE